MLACLALAPLLAGCGEDRSNLIPRDTSDSLIGHFDRTLAELAAAPAVVPVAAPAPAATPAVAPAAGTLPHAA